MIRMSTVQLRMPKWPLWSLLSFPLPSQPPVYGGNGGVQEVGCPVDLDLHLDRNLAFGQSPATEPCYS